MFLSLIVVLQISANLAALAQLANYILLTINGIYTIFITLVVRPLYIEHKLLVEDYKSRTSSIAVEALKKLELKETEEFKEVIEAIKDVNKKLIEIQHDVTALKQSEVNLKTFSNCVEDLTDSVDKLNKNLNK